MITSSMTGAQGADVTVHLKVAEAPMTSPVTPEVGEDGVVTFAVPETTVQAPDPSVGILPANVVVVVLQRI